MRIVVIGVAVLGCLLCASLKPVAGEAPASAPASAPIRDWTILVYTAGDEESLHEPLLHNLKRLEQTEGLVAGAPIHVVLQLDDHGTDANYRYLLQNPAQVHRDRLGTPPISEGAVRRIDPSFRYGERDSGSPVTLKRFLSWAVQAYPARHYMLVLNGHSWGLQGLMQDFYFDGKARKPSSIIKNYELRRLLEEVYREQRAYIPEGRFDVLHIDACISGQLEVALELADVFHYFIAHSVDTPYHGLAFDRVLGPFIAALRAAPAQDAAAAHKQCEEHLLRPLTREYVTQYGPDGLMTQKEKELSGLALFALRTAELPAVAAAVRELVAVLEDTGVGAAFRSGQRPDLDALRDSDDNIDLLHLAQTLKTEWSARYNTTRDARWQRAIDKAQALEGSLSYHAPEVTSLLTPIRHPNAQGAWIHIEVDGWNANIDMLSCELLRLFRIQNQRAPQHIPQLMDAQGRPIPIGNLECEKVAELAQKRKPTLLHAGTPQPISRVYDFKARWPSGIDGFLTEQGTGAPRQRTLSVWIDRGRQTKLDAELMLQLPGTRSIVIEYLSDDPLGYLWKRPGSTARLVGSERLTVADQAVHTDPQIFARRGGGPGLYVAEAHTSGAYFKHGLGIFLRRDFPEDSYRYQRGRLPIEHVEKTPFALTMEAYLAGNFKDSSGKILPLRGIDCYRAHRIRATHWDEFLFGVAK